jgi:hypothetical protein
VLLQGEQVGRNGGARRADGETGDHPLTRDEDQEMGIARLLAAETQPADLEPEQVHSPHDIAVDQRVEQQAEN